MKSKTLTQTMRSHIAARLQRHRFGKEDEQMLQREYDLAEKIRKALLGKNFNLIESLPENIANTVTGVNISYNERYHSLRFSDNYSIRKRALQKMATFMPSDDSEIALEFEKFMKDRDDLRERKKEAGYKANGMLESVNTTKQLIEAWPEIKPFIEHQEPKKKQALSVPIDRLNTMFDLPVKK